MGLSVSHGCWEGGYKSFRRWRTAIAEAVGIPLDLMEGHIEYWITREEFDEIDRTLKYPRSEAVTAGMSILRAMIGVESIQWKALRDDPIVHLLNHSDCDGHIDVEHLAPLADRLEELLPILETYGDGKGHIGNYADKTREFIDGLRLAASLGESIRFA